jgi:hypothetical protein
MGEWQRIIEHLFARLDGPLHFRIVFQPMMATIFAIIDGVKDARAGKPLYSWTVLTDPEHRRELLKDGWKRVGKIFILAVILDIVYQVKVQSTVYPGETLIVALTLALLPYLALRGPINRLLRHWKKPTTGKSVPVRPEAGAVAGGEGEHAK